MNKILNIIIIGTLIVTSFFLGYFIKGTDTQSLEIQDLQKQISSLQQKNSQLQQQINEHQQITSTNTSKNKTLETDCCSQEQKEAGFKCVQDCGPPVVQIRKKYDIPYSCLSPDQIENRKLNGCPICLSSSTKISTPKGEIGVEELKVGMSVWTVDSNGQKVAKPILKVSASLVPNDHKVVHIKLKDGRELWVSRGHPTVVDGINVEELQIGDLYDGSTVNSGVLEQYQEDKTYDILPEGETGYYWANGILMSSTLKDS